MLLNLAMIKGNCDEIYKNIDFGIFPSQFTNTFIILPLTYYIYIKESGSVGQDEGNI